MNESVIVPIIKDKNKRVNDKRNYRPICLSNICSKIIEVVLFNRMSIFLQSSPNQFGFKPKYGTELCVFAFKELLRFYKKHGSAVHVAFWMLTGSTDENFYINLKVVEYRRIF